jgi:hypothetical protein
MPLWPWRCLSGLTSPNLLLEPLQGIDHLLTPSLDQLLMAAIASRSRHWP